MPILITGLANHDPQGHDSKAKTKQKKKLQQDAAENEEEEGARLLTQSSSEDLLHPTQRDARGEDTPQGYLCSMEGLNEIFNLRMYKVPNSTDVQVPLTTSGKARSHTAKTKNILIGASFHLEEDAATGKQRVRAKDIRKKSSATTTSTTPETSAHETRKLANLAQRLQALKSNPVAKKAFEVTTFPVIWNRRHKRLV